MDYADGGDLASVIEARRKERVVMNKNAIWKLQKQKSIIVTPNVVGDKEVK